MRRVARRRAFFRGKRNKRRRVELMRFMDRKELRQIKIKKS
ncbi:MAG: hypothetical protein ACRCX8_02855 [Sarcina sp.]